MLGQNVSSRNIFFTINAGCVKKKLYHLVLNIKIIAELFPITFYGVDSPVESPWFLMVWFVLGHSGQRTSSVKCAEAAWNYKVFLFCFCFVLFCFLLQIKCCFIQTDKLRYFHLSKPIIVLLGPVQWIILFVFVLFCFSCKLNLVSFKLVNS